MTHDDQRSLEGQRGFTLIEVLLVLVILALLAAIAIPIYSQVLNKSKVSAIVSDAHGVYNALMRFNIDEGNFPAMADFDKTTLAPLSTGGYFEAYDTLNSKLAGGEIQLYVQFADQFVILLAPEHDPTNFIYIYHTNIWGFWRDGIYLLEDGELVKSDHQT
jgi:prepilin-type N-terminal cleavage/methylation domain-containing protein